MVGDDHAGPKGFEPFAVLDLDRPAHHPNEPAAEHLSVDVEGMAIASLEEQPDDAGRRAEDEIKTAEEAAVVEEQAFPDETHREFSVLSCQLSVPNRGGPVYVKFDISGHQTEN